MSSDHRPQALLLKPSEELADSLISKKSSLPTALSPSVALVPSSPTRLIKLHFHHDHHYRTLFFEL